MSSDSEANIFEHNIWHQVLRYAVNGVFPADMMMYFCHHGETALMFHAENGNRVGILCSKCFKFFKPGLFVQHTRIAWTLFVPAAGDKEVEG
jgi:hypothetical protein